MTHEKTYEALLGLYDESPLYDDSIRDSLMRVLRLQFTPGEAELAVAVGFEGLTLEAIAARTGIDPARLETMLHTMAEKGTIWTSSDEDPEYSVIGIAGPGLIETGGWGNVRFPHSVKLLAALRTFQIDFARNVLARIPVPVARVWATPSALPEGAESEDDVARKIAQAGRWGVSTCSCRLPHWIDTPGDHCNHLLETCLFLGDMARWGIEHGLCREITLEEAHDILERCNADGLVHTYDPDEFICNCCPDCCVLQIGHAEPGATVLQHSGFVARIEAGTCTACSTCEDRCPFDAIGVDDHSSVDGERCLGCGVCVTTCETGALSLVRRPEEDRALPMA